jgi:hypothetical protein
MIAEEIPAAAWVALGGVLMTSITSVVVAFIGTHRSGKAREEATAGREEATAGRGVILDRMDTGNGHTLGEGVANLERRVRDLHARQDDQDVVLRETSLTAREARDSAAVAADGLLEHLKDADTDRADLYRLKAEWDAAKARVQDEGKEPA